MRRAHSDLRGDIIVEGDDIHGEAENIAARLEGLTQLRFHPRSL